MERLRQKIDSLKKAYTSFEEIINLPYSIIVRDASIQRFEYTFEIFYKSVKEYLRLKKGIIVNTPKSIFREAFVSGLLNEEETEWLLEMTDDRNMTSHTYNEETSEKIYNKLKEYCKIINIVIERIDE